MDAPQPKPPRLLEQIRNRIRYLHYSRKTELSYLSWIRRYILFHNKKHPREMGAEDVVAYLNYLATRRKV